MNKSQSTDQILAELIQAKCETLHSEIHKTINPIQKKKALLQHWKESITVPVYKKGNIIVVITDTFHCYELHTNYQYHPTFFF